MKKRIAYIVIVVCLLIAFGATVTINWLYETFGHLSMDEIIFHLKVPMEGTNTDIIFTFFKECLWKVILPTIIISFALIYPMVKDIKFIKEIHTAERRRTTLTSICIAGLILIISISKIVETTDIKEYIENQTHDSSFISKEYVRPEKTNIEFPEQKRNLIYIFLESMETTYYSTKAYVVRLSEAIREELKKESSKVQISILCPGPVDTNFNKVAGVDFAAPSLSSEYVAKYAVKKMLKNKFTIVPGTFMKITRIFEKIMPHNLVSNVSYFVNYRKDK